MKLSDMVLGFPQTLGEITVRRNSIYEIGLFNESIDAVNDVIDLICRLISAGHRFAGIDRSLIYHSCDVPYTNSDLKNVDTIIHALESTFRDPHCPQALQRYKERVLGNVYLHSSCLAFFCKEISLGQEFLRKSIRFDRSILDLQANKYLTYVILASIEDGPSRSSPSTATRC